MSILALLWDSPILEGLLSIAVIVVCLAAGIKVNFIRRMLAIMLPFSVFMMVTQGFFANDYLTTHLGVEDLHVIFSFPATWRLIGHLKMTYQGIAYAISIIFKTLTLSLLIPLIIYTTDVNRMIVSLNKMHIPYKLTFIFTAMLRFFPLLFDETQKIIEAQKLRGLPFEEYSLYKRVKLYAQLAIPLILGVLVKSQKLEVVLQSKAFTGNPQRTYLHDSTLSTLDYVFFTLFSTFLLIALIAYFYWDVGRFMGSI